MPRPSSTPLRPPRTALAGRCVRGLRRAAAPLAALLLHGWAPVAGTVLATAAVLAGPVAWALPAYVLGAGACRALVRQRRMTAAEAALALAVFGPAFPVSHRIIFTNLCGLGGTCFVCPGLGRQILVNLGRHAFEQPLHCCTSAYHAPGKLLVHELAHAWQIAHGHYFPRLVHRVLAGPRAGDDFYRPPQSLTEHGPGWRDTLNLEQQATIVDEWFAPGRLGPTGWAGTAGMSREHPYWDYVRTVVRLGHD